MPRCSRRTVAVFRREEKRPLSPGFVVLEMGIGSWVWKQMKARRDLQRNPGAEELSRSSTAKTGPTGT